MNKRILTEADAEKLTGEHIVIPHGYTHIGRDAFNYRLDIKSVVIPDSVTEIGEQAFSTCFELTHVEVPNSVTKIGDGAFFACEKLDKITIPDSVKKIGKSVFDVKSGFDPKTHGVVVCCSKRSYAYRYCKNNLVQVEIKD